MLSDAEMHDYARLCNGKPFDEQTLTDIKENLKVRPSPAAALRCDRLSARGLSATSAAI